LILKLENTLTNYRFKISFLVRIATQIATFDAKVKRTTTHQHLFLPKDYSGSPTTSIYTPWTEAEVLSHLATGWGEGAITETTMEYLYGPSLKFWESDTVKGIGSNRNI